MAEKGSFFFFFFLEGEGAIPIPEKRGPSPASGRVPCQRAPLRAGGFWGNNELCVQSHLENGMQQQESKCLFSGCDPTTLSLAALVSLHQRPTRPRRHLASGPSHSTRRLRRERRGLGRSGREAATRGPGHFEKRLLFSHMSNLKKDITIYTCMLKKQIK